MDFQDMASLIRFHRKKSGLTQESLATLAGIGKTAVFDLEHGKATVQLDTVEKVLKVLNLNLEPQGAFVDEWKRGQNP